jgi:hypothetical protein
MLFAGAFIMPVREEYQEMHSMPLFQWLMQQPSAVTWWLWGAVGLLILLTANTLFCSIESIIKKRKVTQWLLLISPQVIHIGFLFILLAHLLSSVGGFKRYAVGIEGSLFDLSQNIALQVNIIKISMDSEGYMTDWYVEIEFISDGKTIKHDRLMPNKPSFRDGFGIYVKDLQFYPKAVFIEVSREPGAIWALGGGVLFTMGSIVLVAIKMRREDHACEKNAEDQ